MLVRKYIIPLLALAGFAFAVYTVRSENQPITPANPAAEPARSPYDKPIAGAGIIEASTQNIAIGAQIPGIVAKVLVRVGDSARAGDPLFLIDDRAQRAEVDVRRAAVMIEERNLAQLRAAPRPEDLPPARASVAEASAVVEDAAAQLALWESINDPRAVAKDDLNKRRFALAAAQARLDAAKSRLSLLEAGTWKPELEVAEARLASARASLMSAETDLDRLTVRAPVDGQVLQVNIRPGEFAQAGPLTTPLILFGQTETLHIRVDIDENDAWRLRPEAPARASLRGNSDLKTELTFVRIEPYVVPKRSLTGDSTERVDTRVLQVIYAFPRSSLAAYVGQQMDVFIEAAKGPGQVQR